MDERAAKQIVNALMSASQQVADTMNVVEAEEPQARAKAYADSVGRVMSDIHALLAPIWAEHPDLRP
jgi:hypothetical protein